MKDEPDVLDLCELDPDTLGTKFSHFAIDYILAMAYLSGLRPRDVARVAFLILVAEMEAQSDSDWDQAQMRIATRLAQRALGDVA